MRFNEVDSIEFLKDGLPPHIKSPVIMANIGGMSTPLCYLKKPKAVSAEDWKEFLDGLYFELRARRSF